METPTEEKRSPSPPELDKRSPSPTENNESTPPVLEQNKTLEDVEMTDATQGGKSMKIIEQLHIALMKNKIASFNRVLLKSIIPFCVENGEKYDKVVLLYTCIENGEESMDTSEKGEVKGLLTTGATGKKKKNKKVSWAEDTSLRIFHFFELDETERGTGIAVLFSWNQGKSSVKHLPYESFLLWNWYKLLNFVILRHIKKGRWHTLQLIYIVVILKAVLCETCIFPDFNHIFHLYRKCKQTKGL